MIKYAELFSGIGVGSLAFKNVFGKDAECAFFSEINGQRVKKYLKHYPDHKNLGDIEFVDIERLPKFDVLIGGSPCQDLSIARGKREGLDGAESGLFYKYLDILREKKPKYFILENVASMRDEDRDEISRCLGVKPVMITSEVFTGQQRKRYYWTNFSIQEWPTEKVDPRIHIDKSVLPDKALDWKAMHSITVEGKKVGKTSFRDRKSDWDWIGWSRSTRYKIFDNKGGFDANFLFEEWKSANPDIDYKIKINTHEHIQISYVEQRIKVNMGAMTCVTGKHCARMSAKNYIRNGSKVREPTVKECLRLQGLPDDYLDGLSETTQYSAIGDGFTLNVIEHILNSLKVVISNEQNN